MLTPEMIEAAAALCEWKDCKFGNWFGAALGLNAWMVIKDRLTGSGLIALECELVRRGWVPDWGRDDEKDTFNWSYVSTDELVPPYYDGLAHDRAACACLAAMRELESA